LARLFWLAKFGQWEEDFGQPDGLAIRIASLLEGEIEPKLSKFNLERGIRRLLEMLLFAPYPSLAFSFSPLPSSRRSRAMAVVSQRAPCLNLPLAMLLARISVFDGPLCPNHERESEKGGGGRERRGKEPIVASLAPACHCRRFPNRPNYWKHDGGKWKGGKREKREVR
jgi:hypothetical protein